jgi:hypothetical protein
MNHMSWMIVLELICAILPIRRDHPPSRSNFWFRISQSTNAA